MWRWATIWGSAARLSHDDQRAPAVPNHLVGRREPSAPRDPRPERSSAAAGALGGRARAAAGNVGRRRALNGRQPRRRHLQAWGVRDHFPHVDEGVLPAGFIAAATRVRVRVRMAADRFLRPDQRVHCRMTSRYACYRVDTAGGSPIRYAAPDGSLPSATSRSASRRGSTRPCS
jgi:hypothetical protein